MIHSDDRNDFKYIFNMNLILMTFRSFPFSRADDRKKFQFLFMSRGWEKWTASSKSSIQSKESITRHFSSIVHFFFAFLSVITYRTKAQTILLPGLFSTASAGSKVISLISHALENEDRNEKCVNSRISFATRRRVDLNRRNFISCLSFTKRNGWKKNNKVES